MRWMPRLLVMGLLLGVSPANGQTPDFASYEITDGVYQFRYRIHYSFFVVTPVGVVAFDPPSTSAPSRTASPSSRLVSGLTAPPATAPRGPALKIPDTGNPLEMVDGWGR